MAVGHLLLAISIINSVFNIIILMTVLDMRDEKKLNDNKLNDKKDDQEVGE